MILFYIYSSFMCHSNDKMGQDEKWDLMKFFGSVFRTKSSDGKTPNYLNILQEDDYHSKKTTNDIHI